MENREPKLEVKKMIEAVIQNLRAKGFDTKNVLAINIDDFKKSQKQDPSPTETKALREECFCPDCFNFETFELKLSPKGGNFEYKTVELMGEEFEIKFHKDAKGEENMMIQKKRVVNEESPEKLKEALNSAVQRQDWESAQSLIDRINKINKNQ